MKDFNGRVAAITGAASGIGRALALELARQGCHLALADKDAVGLEQTLQQVRQVGAGQLRVTSQVLDVADREAMFAWAASSAASHGGINLIFNNAGVALSSTVEGLRPEDLEWILGINFWGMVHGTQAFMPYLKQSGAGHVVNVSSVFGLLAQPGMGAYNASKYAVRGFTESLRQELDLQRAGVSATCVHPGGVKTAIARSGRVDSSVIGLLIDNEAQGRRDFERFFITTADRAARRILAGVRSNRRRVLIGADARALDILVRLLPGAYQILMVAIARYLKREASRRPSPAPTPRDQRPSGGS